MNVYKTLFVSPRNVAKTFQYRGFLDLPLECLVSPIKIVCCHASLIEKLSD